ncbi:pentapeptide repeat-containing protein [Amycolatopsis sp. NBC_00345]|uniref:pentapeptide repeat-containing protein n=1 Tax=Amycolatopsis sp. NBC_00345 TaxID=2975955 RepID=UPI002E26D89A
MTMQPTGPGERPAPDETPPSRYPELSNRAIVWAAVVLIVIGASLATVLLIVFGNGQHPAQLDAIKTAGTIVLGTGGAAALWLTARRQRTAEITLNQQREANEAAKHDATERRLTELYVKAVEQLGSDKAAVRHGGLYALERVAQDNPDQRQTIVDVVCAYLRAPYTPPGESGARRLGVKRPLLTSTPTRAARASLPHDNAPTAPTRREVDSEARQEREVRLTAQRLLTRHLRPGDEDRPADTFWTGIRLDLTGATLINFDLSRCHVEEVLFNVTTFIGTASFAGATFIENAMFRGATFTENATFYRATFTENAMFYRATFTENAVFRGTRFTGPATFDSATFTGIADFDEATFTNNAWFGEATFTRTASFHGTMFTEGAPDEVAPYLASPSDVHPGSGANSE